MLSLSAWTSLVDLLALAASLWLGLYIVTRNPRARISWLASLTLWSLSGYFLDSFLHLNRPHEQMLAWWTGWTVLLSAPLWLHLCVLLTHRESTWYRYLAWSGYLWAVVLVVAELATGDVLGVLSGEPFVYATAQQPGRWYPAVFALLVVAPLISIGLLYRAGRSDGRPLAGQRDVLVSATALALAGGLYLTSSVWFSLRVAILPGQVALALALILLGYGVARYNALVEGRSTTADFAYALVAILAVIAVYLLVTYVSYRVFEIPFAVFIFVLMLVIVTHSLYEWGVTTLERLFFRRRYQQLRADLRAFAQEAEAEDVEPLMSAILRSLCESVGCTQGWIALADGMDSQVTAYPAGQRMPQSEVLREVPDEVRYLDEAVLRETGLSAAVIVPLLAGGEALGTIVLVQRDGAAGWDEPRHRELLESVADQVASAVIVARQQRATAEQIELAVHAFREREHMLRQELQAAIAAGSATGGEELSAARLRPLIEDALRHLYDYAYLGEQELADLTVTGTYVEGEVDVVTNLDRGRALSQMLVDVIEKLRPPGPIPALPAREWEQYTILHDAYVIGTLNREIMAKLYISESSFNRARRRAVRGVARAVAEMERAMRRNTG
ncbi:MAG: GAF domain-containing protein [Anaerolineae bacterium]